MGVGWGQTAGPGAVMGTLPSIRHGQAALHLPVLDQELLSDHTGSEGEQPGQSTEQRRGGLGAAGGLGFTQFLLPPHPANSSVWPSWVGGNGAN